MRTLIGGREISTYEADLDELSAKAPFGFDFVVVDGPSAEPGARVATLIVFRPLLAPGALIFMDDALRDGELWAANQWAAMPELEVMGVVLVDKGVLRARVRDSAGIAASEAT